MQRAECNLALLLFVSLRSLRRFPVVCSVDICMGRTSGFLTKNEICPICSRVKHAVCTSAACKQQQSEEFCAQHVFLLLSNG